MDSKLTQLLNQYAQDYGFKDMAHLKEVYTPQAYERVFPQFVARAQAELEAHNA